MGGEQSETISYWDPENGADEDSVPAYSTTNNLAYYNWYAATAGSGTSDMTVDIPADSICPFGWKIPEIGEGNKTWRYLHTNLYFAGSDQKNSEFFRTALFSMLMKDADNKYWHWSSSSLTSNSSKARTVIVYNSLVSSSIASGGILKSTEALARCVKK